MSLNRFHRDKVAIEAVNSMAFWGAMFVVICLLNRSAMPSVLQRDAGRQQNELTVESDVGVLFINGTLVVSPYEIDHEDDCVYVNGHRLEVPDGVLNGAEERTGRIRGFGQGGPAERYSNRGRLADRERSLRNNEIGRSANFSSSRFARDLRDQLLNAGLLIFFDGYPLRVVAIDGEGLSGVLAAGDVMTEKRLIELNVTESTDETAVWMNWLSSYEVSSELQSQIQAIIDDSLAFENEFRSNVAQVARLEKYAYPLTVVGMLLGVVALGYMLQWAGNGLHQLEMTAASDRYVLIALFMMTGMAAVDFVWTVLAGQAGQMKEVNPLAAQFIESPTQLAVFKILATGIGFGILYFYRRQQQIRQATWWMCLVSVLLTFRWVMFDSMRI